MYDYEKLGEAKTPNEMRQALQKASRDIPLINKVFQMAYYEGLSGEDKYTLLAYLAMKENIVFTNQNLKFMRTHIAPSVVLEEHE